MRTIEDAIKDDDPDMVVEHDGLAPSQTCERCGCTWGDTGDDYRVALSWTFAAIDGEVCPDPDCRGDMGLRASLHRDWPEDEDEDEDEVEDEATIHRGHALDLSAVEWKLRALDGISRTLEEKLGGPDEKGES